MIYFIYSFVKIAPFFLLVNFFVKIFGVFDELYFTYASLLYGFMGNFCYSLYQIFQFLGDESEDVKPINKKRWLFLALRPFAAGLSSFIISAMIVAFFSGFGDNILGFVKNSGTALIVGILSGLYFDHLTNKKFLDTFFEKKIKDKIFDK